ncbi:nucleolin [Drosophila ficusphila]|uniref:nucleolin n=1 Tax=Drosophila ficusphila TaxID=30025 RepID=UPI0007E646BF|nr:nucleolin [Drosophila ficusphila]
MKLLFGVLVTVLALSGVFSLPARSDPQDDAEVIKVPTRPDSEPDFHNFRGVVDTGAGNPFFQPSPSSFNVGFFDSFDDLFRRLRTRIWPVIGSDSSEDRAPAADDSSDEPGSGFAFGLRPLIPLNPNKANTTSTVKVVDGHKVEINETVYGDSNSVFKVRLVNVRPLESGEEVAQGVHTNGGDFQPVLAPSTSAPSTKGGEFDEEDDDDRREPLEKQPEDNEVRDIDEPKSTTPTTTTTSSTTQQTISSPADSESEASDISEEIMETLSEEQKKTMDQLQAMMASVQKDLDQDHEDKEALEKKEKKEREEFDSSDDEDGEATTPVMMSETFNDEWAEFEQDPDQDQSQEADHDPEFDLENDLNNEIDIEENFVPIDLSNDIAVNDQAAADPNFPHNPDAEIIVGPSVIGTMPMFEKLSLEDSSK